MSHPRGRSAAAQFFNADSADYDEEEDYGSQRSSGSSSTGGRRMSSSGLGGSSGGAGGGPSRLSTSRLDSTSSFEANDYQDEAEVRNFD
jgi:hypothetical protein